MRAVSHAREAEGVVFGGGQGGEESEAEGAEAEADGDGVEGEGGKFLERALTADQREKDRRRAGLSNVNKY